MGFKSGGFCARSSFCPLLAVLLGCGLLTTNALGQSDNFNSGTDSAWTHYDPMATFGSPATFSFPNGGYRIHANVSPNPSVYGPGRVASYRSTPSYSDFYETVDIVTFDTTLNQAFGLLGHLSSIGLGTTNGYALTYSTNDHAINLSLINGENPTNVVSATLSSPLQLGHSYQLVFTDLGSLLSGHIYDNGNPTVSLADLSAVDSTHPSGVSGLLVYDNSGSSGNVGADATFDNYFAAVTSPEPATLALVAPFGAMLLLKRRQK